MFLSNAAKIILLKSMNSSLNMTQSEQIHAIFYPELELFPYLKHGLFPKQQDAKGMIRSATQEEIRAYLKANHCCFLRQVHSTSLVHIKESIPQGVRADGMITSKPNISLHIKHSDCQAAFIYDPENHVVANVHCGWRSLLGNIYACAIHRMHQYYKSKPCNLIVLISPSLGPNYAIYPDYNQLFPPSFVPFISDNHIDFRAIARKQLLELGVLKKNLYISERCTYEENDVFFSFRYRQNHHQTNKKKRKNIVRTPHNNISAIMLLPRE